MLRKTSRNVQFIFNNETLTHIYEKENFVIGVLHRNPGRLEEIKNPIKTINIVVNNFTVKETCLQNFMVPRNTV